MPESPTVWDWPLRLWHWAFAVCIGFSLYSGLRGDIGLMQWHQRSGLALLGLLVFRLGWACWGGRYARFRHYWTTPAAFRDHFLRRRVAGNGSAGVAAGGTVPHTAPGIALVLLMLLAAGVQIGTGLFATDDIFTEGPLTGLVSAEFARTASWVHRRLHWVILAAVGVHLTAHAVYAFVLRDRTPLAMFTGRKPVEALGRRHSPADGARGACPAREKNPAPFPSTPHYWARAALTGALSVGVVLIVVWADRLW